MALGRERLRLRIELAEADSMRAGDSAPSVAAGWALVLDWPALKSPPLDQDPHRPGIQPFVLAMPDAPVFEIENRFDAELGRLHFAASRIGAGDGRVGGVMPTMEIASALPVPPLAILDLEVADARGRVLNAVVRRSDGMVDEATIDRLQP